MFRTVPLSFLALTSALSVTAQAMPEPEAGTASEPQDSWFEEPAVEQSNQAAPAATPNDGDSAKTTGTRPRSKPTTRQASTPPTIDVTRDSTSDRAVDTERKSRSARRHDGFYLRL